MSRQLLGLILLIVWTCACKDKITNSNSANRNTSTSSTTSGERNNNQSAQAKDPYSIYAQRERDKAITSYIDTRLNRQGLCGVKVSTEMGEVLLTGQVETEIDKVLAERMASDVPDVTGVRNQIVVVSADPNLNKRAGPKGRPCT